jgi:hypothetical protein
LRRVSGLGYKNCDSTCQQVVRATTTTKTLEHCEHARTGPAKGWLFSLLTCGVVMTITLAETVTLDRLERGLAVAAYLVALDGPVMVPIFEKLERELEAMRASQDAVGRAMRMIESYRTVGGVKAIA